MAYYRPDALYPRRELQHRGRFPSNTAASDFTSFSEDDSLAERGFCLSSSGNYTAPYPSANTSSFSNSATFGRESFHKDGSRSDQFYRDPGVQVRRGGGHFSQERFPDPFSSSQPSFSGVGAARDPAYTSFDYREQLSTNPTGSQEAFHFDRDRREFSQGGTGRPLMPTMNFLEERLQFDGGGTRLPDPVSQTRFTGFDSRSRIPSGSTGDQFLQSNEWRSSSTHTDPWREQSQFGMRGRRGSSGSQRESVHSEFSYHPQPRFKSENPPDFTSNRDSSSGKFNRPPGGYNEQYTNDPLMGRYSKSSSLPEPCSVPSSGRRSRQGSESFDRSVENFLRGKGNKGRSRKHPNPYPRQDKQREYQRVEDTFLGQGSVATVQSRPPPSLSGRSKHVPRSRRSSKSEWEMQRSTKEEPQNWGFDVHSTHVKTKERERTKGRDHTSRKSDFTEVYTRRSLRESLEFGDLLKHRSPSPKSIQERLGPHIPGSGSVQNRLGPPKERAGVHTRLGPEENSSAPLENVHSRLGSGENLGGSLPSDSIHSRLGLSENLSSSPHFHLGSRENLSSSLGSDSIHSRLGPEESFSDPVPSVSVRQEDYFSAPHTTSSIHLEPDKNLGGPLTSDSVYSRLGPSENLGVHSRLGPEILSQAPRIKTEPDASSDPLLNFAPSCDSVSLKPMVSDIQFHSRSENQGRSPLHTPDLPPSSILPSTFGSASSRLSSHSDSHPMDYSTSLHSDTTPSLRHSPTLYLPPDDPPTTHCSVNLDLIHSSTMTTSPVEQETKLLPQHPVSYQSDELQSLGAKVISSISQEPSSATLPSPTNSVKYESTKATGPLKGSHSISPSLQRKTASSRVAQSQKQTLLSPSVKSPIQELSTPTTGLESKQTLSTVLSRSKVTKKLSDIHTSTGTKVPEDTAVVVGQSIPTLLQGKSIPPSPKAPAHHTPVQKSVKVKDVPLSKSRKLDGLPKSQSITSEKAVGYKVSSSDRQKDSTKTPIESPSKTSDQKDTSNNEPAKSSVRALNREANTCVDKQVMVRQEKVDIQVAVNSEEKMEITSSVESVPIENVNQRDSENGPSENQLKVGVASVVTYESEMEEGEMTDSECEDLVIDLDRSLSSASTPKKVPQLKPPSGNVSTQAKSDSLCSKAKPDTSTDEKKSDVKISTSAALHKIPESEVGTAIQKQPEDGDCKITKGHLIASAGLSSGTTSGDCQDIESVESWQTDHQETKAVHDTPIDHKKTAVVDRHPQEGVPGHHQKTNPAIEWPSTSVKPTTSLSHKTPDSESDVEAVGYLQSGPAATIKSCETNSSMSSSESAIPEDSEETESFTILKPMRAKLSKKAAVVLGSSLAKTLNSERSVKGGSSLLHQLRISSAKLCELIKRLFHPKSRSGVNIDVILSYMQRRLPACALSVASVARLAELLAVNSHVYFFCDLYVFHQHCGTDIAKWRALNKQYMEANTEFLPYSRLRDRFPSSVQAQMGSFLSSQVRRLIKDVNPSEVSYKGVKVPNSEPTFLNEAKMKYGQNLEEMLDRISQRLSSAQKDGKGLVSQPSVGESEAPATMTTSMLRQSSLPNLSTLTVNRPSTQVEQNQVGKILTHSVSPLALESHSSPNRHASQADGDPWIDTQTQSNTSTASSLGPTSNVELPSAPLTSSGSITSQCSSTKPVNPSSSATVSQQETALHVSIPSVSQLLSACSTNSTEGCESGNDSLTVTEVSLQSKSTKSPEVICDPSTNVDSNADSTCVTADTSVVTTEGTKPSLSAEPCDETATQPHSPASVRLHDASPTAKEEDTKEDSQLKDTVPTSEDQHKKNSITITSSTAGEETSTTGVETSSTTGVEKASDDRLDESKTLLEADDAAVENVSISSGEIVSPPLSPTATCNNLYEGSPLGQDGENSEGFGPSSSRGSSNWRGRGYFSPGPQRHLPQYYDCWRSRSPVPGNWRQEERGWNKGSRGSLHHCDSFTKRRRMARSRSRSSSPERYRFSKRRRRNSSEDAPRGRRYMRSSLSPDADSRKFGQAYANWCRQRRETYNFGRRKRWRGEGEKRVRTSRSCDRQSGKEIGGTCSSDEDIEVLELRKEAIMSMLKDSSGDKKSVGDDDEKNNENTEKQVVQDNSQVVPSEAVESGTMKGVSAETGSEKFKETETVAANKTELEKEVSENCEVVQKPEQVTDYEFSSKEHGGADVTATSEGSRSEEVESMEVCDEKDGKVTDTELVVAVSSPLAEPPISAEDPSTSTDPSSTIEASSLKESLPKSPVPSSSLSHELHPSSPADASVIAPSQASPSGVQKEATRTATVSGSQGKSTAGKKTGSLAMKKTSGLKASSVPSSRSGSQVGSPASSRGSPAPPPSGTECGMELGTVSRRGSTIQRTSTKPPTSVTVVPSSKVTWEIPEFLIQVPDSDSDDGHDESESEQESGGSRGTKVPHRPPTMDEIDSVLGQFRRDAEAKAKQKEAVRPPSPLTKTEGESLQSTLEIGRIDVDKTEAVGMLPLKQQREYLELKKKLVLHEKRQRQEAITEKVREKGKQPLNSTASKKMKIIRLEQVKNQTSGASLVQGNTVREASSTQQRESDEMEVKDCRMIKEEERARIIKENEEHKMEAGDDSRRMTEAEERAGQQEQQRVEDERKRREAEERAREQERQRMEDERKRREAEERKKIKAKWKEEQKRREMKVAELEGKIRSCRSQTERWARILTSVTHEMAECESEMEEHELKIELLRKQLELARSGRDQCKQQRMALQRKVRDAQDHISQHSAMIQDTQRLLIKERDLLITMESGHGDSTDMETVSMEIDSDGSKGEVDMEMVTSSDDEGDKATLPNSSGKASQVFTPLTYEAVSDAEGPVCNPILSTNTEFSSNVLVPNSGLTTAENPATTAKAAGKLSTSVTVTSPGVSVSAGRGKRRRLSKSQRTRKSSLSISHTAAGQASDSEIDEIGKNSTKSAKLRRRSGKVVTPPDPSDPPPHLPAPPASNIPSTPSPPVGTERSDIVPKPPARPSQSSSTPSLSGKKVNEIATPDSLNERVHIQINDTKVDEDVTEGVSTKPRACYGSEITEAAEEQDEEKSKSRQPKSRLIFSATLPLPPLEVEFITDTDTGSEDGSSVIPAASQVGRCVNGSSVAFPAGGSEDGSSVMPVPSPVERSEDGTLVIPVPSPVGRSEDGSSIIPIASRVGRTVDENSASPVVDNTSVIPAASPIVDGRPAASPVEGTLKEPHVLINDSSNSSADKGHLEGVPIPRNTEEIDSEIAISHDSHASPAVTDTKIGSSSQVEDTSVTETNKGAPVVSMNQLTNQAQVNANEVAPVVSMNQLAKVDTNEAGPIVSMNQISNQAQVGANEAAPVVSMNQLSNDARVDANEAVPVSSEAEPDSMSLETTNSTCNSSVTAPKPEEESARGAKRPCVDVLPVQSVSEDTVSCDMSCDSDSSVVHNPFISMLKISKIESLSDSPEASSMFSPVQKDIDPSMTSIGDHMTTQAHHVTSHDLNTPPSLPTERSNLPDCVSVQTEKDGAEVFPSNCDQITEPVLSPMRSQLISSSDQQTCSSELTAPSHTHTVYITLLDESDQGDSTVPVGKVSKKGTSARKKGEGKKQAKKSQESKKQDGVLRKRAGDGGRVTKSTKRDSVGKLPLTRSGSDSELGKAARRTRRKSTPKRLISKTTPPSPSQKSVLLSPRTHSSALITALQTTLQSALSPALVSLLSPSSPLRGQPTLQLDRQMKKSSSIPVTLNKTLQHTLNSALSPALESLLSPSSYCRLLGDESGRREAQQATDHLEDSTTDAHSSEVRGGSVLEKVNDSNELEVRSHDPGVTSHDTVMTSHPVANKDDKGKTDKTEAPPSFLSGPNTPVFTSLPRSVPDIPFEIGSASINVHTLRSLLQARFPSGSGARGSRRSGESVFDGMKTSESERMETSENDSKGVHQSASEDAMQSSGTKNDSMKTSQNDSMKTRQNELHVLLQGTSNHHSNSQVSTTKPPQVMPPSLPPPPVTSSSVLRTVLATSCSTSVRPTKMPVETKTSGSSTSQGKVSSKVKSKAAVVIATIPPESGTPVEYLSKKTTKLKQKTRSVPSTSASSLTNTSQAKSPCVEGLLGKIQQVKANLELRVQGQTTGTRGTQTTPSITAAKKSGTSVTQVNVQSSRPSAVSTSHSASKERGTQAYSRGTQQLRSFLMQGQPTKGVKKEPAKKVGPGSSARSPQKKAGKLGKAAASNTSEVDTKSVGRVYQSKGLSLEERSMDMVTKELGFSVSWRELEVLLKPSSQKFEPLQTIGASIGGMPLLIGGTNENSRTRSEVVSELVLESLEKQNVQTVEPISQPLRSIHRYKPYSSPLLSFQSYRLSPHYRTHERLQLSSLSHSNKIDPMKIMCKFDVFGKCGDSHCTGQHFRDIKPTHAELVDDIIAYSPSPSMDDTKTTTTDTSEKTSVKNPQKGSSDSSQKKLSRAETLIADYGSKLSHEQLLTLATHHVSRSRVGREGGGVVTAEEVRCQPSSSLVSKDEEKSTRPPPLYWTVNTNEQGWPDSLHPTGNRALSTQADQNDTSSKLDRYFATPSPSQCPATSTDPAHFLSLAREAGQRDKACGHLKAGLALHNQSEELWLEYLQMKSSISSTSGSGLTDSALTSCPTYAVIMKCIEVAESVVDKDRCIERGYQIIVNQSQSMPSLSHCCVELLLSHAYLHSLSGSLDVAVSILQHSLETDDVTTAKRHIFTDITTHLSLPHLQLAYLTLLFLLYTSTFPDHLTLSPHTATIPVRLKQNVDSLHIPWSKRNSLSHSKLQKIEQLLAVAITRCQCQDPTNSMETTFALYHNLILFQLTHRSREIAQQTLNGLLNCSPHSTQLWLLAAQLQDWTACFKTALDVLERARESRLDSRASELYCYAVKLIMSQVDGCRGDVMTDVLPWIQDCVCQFYRIPDSSRLQLSLSDTALLYRKLLGQMVPFDYSTPDVISSDNVKKNVSYLWITYCLLVQLSHHTLRGDYYHSSPEEAFESAVHSVNRPSDLRIVWLEYLSYLRGKAVSNKGNHSAFKAFSDCVYRCLVVMDTKKTTPTLVPGQPTVYHDFTFHEQVCDLYFSCLPPSTSFHLSSLKSLIRKFPDNPYLISRFSQHCLRHSSTSLDSTQAVLAGFLSAHPKCLPLWRLAIQVEVVLKNTREARWLFREALKHIPLSADLWKEVLVSSLLSLFSRLSISCTEDYYLFLLFELQDLSRSPLPSLSPSLSLARDLVHKASCRGITLTPPLITSSSSVSPSQS